MGTTIGGVGVPYVGAATTRTSAFSYNSSCCRKKKNDIIVCHHHHHHHRGHLHHHQLQNRRSNISKLVLGSNGRITIKALPQFGQTFSCKAVEQSTSTSTIVYEGAYGPWTVDPSDVREVILYRSGLVTAALSFVLASSTTFVPGNSVFSDILGHYLDLFYLLGSGGLGLSLFLIHIYVTEIKRTLQALWALGVIGSLITYAALAQPAGQGLVQYVVDNPTAIWLVGPVFAALTGLVFKEGLCYGKLEAAVLTIIIPTCLLGHLTGIMDDVVKSSLLGVWMVLFIIFAGRKFTQPIKDDIGDKSVFMFNALPAEKKAALLEKLEQQRL